MMPMLDESIELAADAGAHEVVIGMAHRGRLNVLAHTVGRSYESILREFEGERTIDAVVVNDEGGTGDVKYHLSATGTRKTASGEVTITLAPNPSHLEAVDPVVEGWTRAEQTDRSGGAGIHDPSVALPILIHGDASFAGQGIVAETLNLSSLDGYTTGGTLHLIANNQVGFTTNPNEGRSTRYSSDLAKGFDIPIIHVNANDPEAAIAAVRLALAYRQEFGHDIVVDLVGYRRFGHNEQDEAAYTQPLMVAQIAAQPPVGQLYAARLVADGVLSEDEAKALFDATQQELRAAHDRLKESIAEPRPVEGGQDPGGYGRRRRHRRPRRPAHTLNEQLLQLPEGFEGNEKLLKQLERRRERMREGGIDWGQAEALAFASLLVEGIPIRVSGQDTERGTFSHRHAVLHDQRTGETHAPIQVLPDAGASFEIYNSPLSEYACLGFEYGYAVAAPDALVLWEAQYGDFVNGAQIVIDQFLVAGLSKWGQTSRLTLLLPHGYEGNGPEHSSAKLERFLQLAAQENIRVANVTTAAQYFHLLRRQALDATARPLVVMTPKGLLRLKQASSALADFSEGRFEPVLDDPGADRNAVTRLVLTLRQALLRHRGTRGARPRRVRRRRPDRAALPVPGRAGGRADRLVPLPPRARLGAGGAAEHGCLAHDPAPARGGGSGRRPRHVRRAGPGARARARATRRRTASSRTGSFARRSAAARVAARASACAGPPARPPRSSGRECARRASSGGAAQAAAGARGRTRRSARPTGLVGRMRGTAACSHMRRRSRGYGFPLPLPFSFPCPPFGFSFPCVRPSPASPRLLVRVFVLRHRRRFLRRRRGSARRRAARSQRMSARQTLVRRLLGLLGLLVLLVLLVFSSSTFASTTATRLRTTGSAVGAGVAAGGSRKRGASAPPQAWARAWGAAPGEPGGSHRPRRRGCGSRRAQARPVRAAVACVEIDGAASRSQA